MRIGGQELTLEAGSNLAFTLLTGTECAA
jgi:hypothetical protein